MSEAIAVGLDHIRADWPATCSTQGMSRLLQVLGALSVVAFAVTGVGAWLLTKDQIRVTIAAAEPARAADDPVAELADRIATLEEDVRALARGLGEGLAQFDAALAEAADARHAEQGRRISAQFDALRRELSAQASRHAESDAKTLAELAMLRGALEAEANADLVVRAAPPPPLPAEAEQPPEPIQAPVEPAPPEPGVPPEPVEAAPRKRPSFLAFRLPSDEFSFEGPRTWEVLADLSRVGFDAKSTLHDFTGVTQAVDARLRLDLAHLDRTAEGSIEVDPATLDTGLEGRDDAMRDHLATDEHKVIRFELTSVEPKEVDAAKMRATGTAFGKMTIHGRTLDVSMPVRLSVDGARRLHVDGEMPLVMSEYGIEVPSQLGLISVTDEVKVWIALRAHPVRDAATQEGGRER